MSKLLELYNKHSDVSGGYETIDFEGFCKDLKSILISEIEKVSNVIVEDYSSGDDVECLTLDSAKRIVREL